MWRVQGKEGVYFGETNDVQTIHLTLCGNPQPKLKYTWNGKSKEASVKLVNETLKMYRYEMKSTNIKRWHCGSKVRFTAIGFKNWEYEATLMVKCE